MLDHDKRQKIIALLSNGSSRRMAAKYVRCSPSTIARTAAADPVFADQLAAAESSAEIDAIRAIRAAYRKDRYWRAAAWLLERKNPEDFARRSPTIFTAEEVCQVISIIVEILNQDIPEENCQKALHKLEELIESQRYRQTNPTLPDESNPLALTHNPLPPEHPSFEFAEVPTSNSDPIPDPDDTSIEDN
jgi:hypothetical protein